MEVEPGAGSQAASRPALAPSATGSLGRRTALRRLQTARGHVDAVIRMLEADRYCIDILYQLAAVEAALARARQEVMEGHLRGCVAEAVRGGSIGVEDAAGEVLAAVFGGSQPGARSERRAVP